MSDEMEVLVEKQKRGARSNQKLKILYLAKILLENTDANHAHQDGNLGQYAVKLNSHTKPQKPDGNGGLIEHLLTGDHHDQRVQNCGTGRKHDLPCHTDIRDADPKYNAAYYGGHHTQRHQPCGRMLSADI